MSTPQEIAAELLDLPDVVPEQEAGVVAFLHANLAPRLRELAALDPGALAAEPDLDPGRAPRTA